MIIFFHYVDIILFLLLAYLIEYGIIKHLDVDIFNGKVIFINIFFDILLILFIGYFLGYAYLDFLFPLGLNWFLYSVLV